MTLDEFFAALEETQDMGWKCNERGVLRACADGLVSYCPITAVAMHELGEYYDAPNYDEAAEALGFSSLHAADIALCADAPQVTNPLRDRLLAAVGLA